MTLMLLYCKTDDSDEIMARAAQLVSSHRREKAFRLPTRRARVNSMAAELLARYALQQYGLDPEMLLFDRTGRPCVRSNAAYLSLSHSGEYVACAVSSAPVGVDIQEIRAVNRLVITRVCTPAEQATLHNSEDISADFTRLWSLKEAWRKANPVSSTREMLRAEFFISESGEVRGPDGFYYTIRNEPKGYSLALCETEPERNFPIHETTKR